MTEVCDYIKKSFELKNQGYYKPAIEMLYKALAIESDNIEILAQLAHLYKMLDNYQRSIYYIEKVLELDKNHVDSLFLLKEIYLEQNNLNLAVNSANRIYDIQPTCENLAQTLSILNKMDDFESIKEIVSTAKNPCDKVLYELAFAHYKNYDAPKAIELLQDAIKINDKNENALLLLAKIHFDNKDVEQSKKLFERLKQINPTSEVLNYLGLFKLEKQNFTAAIEYFQKALKLETQNNKAEQTAQYAYNLASAYFLNGWLDEAQKYFTQAICLDSNNIDYHYSLAYLYYQQKAYDKALFELDFIKSIDQNHNLTNILYAMIIGKQGDLFAAKAQLENIIKFSETDDFAYFALSEINKELVQIQAAKENLIKAIELNPKSLEYLTNLAEIELEQKNYDESMTLARKIIEINKKYTYGYTLIAKINYERANFNEVFEAAQNIINLDSNSPEGYYYNALALYKQGDTNFAIESLKKAISLDLNNSALYVKMSEFYQDLGDLKMAYEWAKEASNIDEKDYKNKWLCAKLAASLFKDEEATKYYTQSYRLGGFDKDLSLDYSKYLKSIGKQKQSQKIIR